MEEFVDKFFEAIEGIKAGRHRGFSMRFKSKKKNIWDSVKIRSREWNRKTGKSSSVCSNSKLRVSCSKNDEFKLPDKMVYDYSILRSKTNQYYIVLPKPLVIKGENQILNNSKAGVCAIDPGVRTFATCYDASGYVYEWGKGDISRIFRLLVHLDRLIGKTAKANTHRSRYNMRKAQSRIRIRIQNLVSEFHKKCISWLLSKGEHRETLLFRVILLPKFNVSHMTVKGKRKIGRKSVRQMLSWSHHKFRTRKTSFREAQLT